MLTRIAAVLGLVVLNAFFVAAEFALVRARRTRLEAMAREGDPLARLALRATDDLIGVLSACQLGVTLASLGLGWVAEAAVVESLAGTFEALPLGVSVAVRASIATVVALAIVTYLTVVFGELAPKNAALNNPERWSRYLVPPLLLFQRVTAPFTWLLNHSAALVVRVLGMRPVGAEEQVHSPEELRMLVEQSEEVGALEQQDAALLDAVFEFSEKNAREVMTPRTEIVALDVNATPEEILQTVSESGLSRFPVYEESIDDIIGIVLAKDLIPVLARGTDRLSLRPLLRPVYFIPGSREVEDVLSDFKRRKEHMAIVLDEYGGTAGVVTMEDLLEEIVGEILDEYDEPEEETVTTSGGETLVAGGSNIRELNEQFGTAIPEEEYTTIGGYVFGALGRLPQVGDRVSVGGATFTVRELEGRKVATLALELTPAEATPAAGRDEPRSQRTGT